MQNIRIVMVHTSHPGNIGAAARAMKNMGIGDLALVRPAGFPSAEASARASGADDLLSSAGVFPTLADAVADCRQVVGASARLRSISVPVVTPREAAGQAVAIARARPVALVFGRESSGLTNEELDLCTSLVHIPCNPAFSSLNVAMAIQILCYELRIAAEGAPIAAPKPQSVASVAEMEGLFGHLDQALRDIGFTEAGRSRKLMRRLRRLFQRAEPDPEEVNILRGILSAAQGRKSMRRE